MLNTIMLLPKTQLVSTYIQNASDAAWIGGAEAVALQFFVEGLDTGSSVTFTVQESTSKTDDQFIDTAKTATISTGSPDPQIVMIDYNETAGFIRLKVAVTVGSAAALECRCQMNIKGR